MIKMNAKDRIKKEKKVFKHRIEKRATEFTEKFENGEPSVKRTLLMGTAKTPFDFKSTVSPPLPLGLSQHLNKPKPVMFTPTT